MKLFLDESNFIETDEPLDISLPLQNNSNNPIAWYVDIPVFEPVRTAQFTGAVKEGGSVNFRNIFFNPHGHGTHTECLGHITEEVYSVNQVLRTFFFKAQVLSINPIVQSNEDGHEDLVIGMDQLPEIESGIEALIVRTLPNSEAKKHRNYSATNPPYLEAECAEYIINKGIKHLLVDLPSVDREMDNGVLAFHHAFWEVPQNPNFERTITELLYVPDEVKDGIYMLNLQIASFENDASPSKPTLYAIKKRKS